MFYVGFKTEDIKKEPLTIEHKLMDKSPESENQTVMAQDVPRIKADTQVVFEISDQFGTIIQTEIYTGITWLDYTKPQMAKVFPDYAIAKYGEDGVKLTRVIERKIEPNHILTRENGNIVISIEQNGHKIFHEETGFEQHDFSDTLVNALNKGIPITPEQKDAILENPDELYMILQEYDE